MALMNRRPRRGGVSLIEMIAVLAVLGIAMMMVSACATLARTGLDRTVQDVHDISVTQSVADRLRRDAHRASGAATLESGKVRWPIHGGMVRYAVVNDAIVMQTQHNGKVQHERWEIGMDTQAKWELQRDGRLLVLRIGEREASPLIVAAFPGDGGES